jgi:hypothetical protein
MAEAASMLTLVLFLAFMTSGAQKIALNEFMSHTAERLGFSKAGFRRVGVVELAGAIALLVGLASKGDVYARLNEGAAVVLALAALFTLVGQLRAGDSIRRYGPILGLISLCAVELVLRLTL